MSRIESEPIAMQKQIKCGLLALVIAFAFCYGVGVGVYHWPPYSLLLKLKGGNATVPSDDPEQQLLDYVFTEPVISGDQILDSVKNLDDLHHQLDAMILPIEAYWDAAESMSIDLVSNIQLNENQPDDCWLMQVQYSIDGRSYDAYAYRNSPATEKANDSAAMVIPGSGSNQSHAIYGRDLNNYQSGILEAFPDDTDTYVFIKPNQDCLAIHNGEKRLHRDGYSNWLVSKGASYSAHYLVSSIAITKALQSRYSQVSVCGLSQGGEAALLNALQTAPSRAIVASGYSSLYDKVKWAADNQITLPGFLEKLSIPQIGIIISGQKTQYLFTWGVNENGTYGIEAKQGLLREAFSHLDNVTCAVHPGGHAYPLSTIREFCSSP